MSRKDRGLRRKVGGEPPQIILGDGLDGQAQTMLEVLGVQPAGREVLRQRVAGRGPFDISDAFATEPSQVTESDPVRWSGTAVGMALHEVIINAAPDQQQVRRRSVDPGPRPNDQVETAVVRPDR